MLRVECRDGQRPINVRIIDALATHDQLGHLLQHAERSIAMPHLVGEHKLHRLCGQQFSTIHGSADASDCANGQ